MQTTTNELSATALAKKLNKYTQDVNEQLSEMHSIVKTDDTWQLTTAGQSKGGSYRHNPNYGRYIVWPESLLAEPDQTEGDSRQNLLTATSLGKAFGIPSTRMNLILSELGWITRANDMKGWEVTESRNQAKGSAAYRPSTRNQAAHISAGQRLLPPTAS